MMEEIIAILSSLILGTPGWVMMPLVLLFIGKAFGLSWGKALKHGLLWGIGIWGLTTILGTIAPQLITPVLQMSTRLGLSKNILDTWAVWNSMWVISLWPILAIGLGLAWNVVLLLIGITKTFDVDIWNYHFIAVIAMYTEFLTGSFYIAIGAFLISRRRYLSHTYNQCGHMYLQKC
jgi:PTS system galactitol-specific IIC component